MLPFYVHSARLLRAGKFEDGGREGGELEAGLLLLTEERRLRGKYIQTDR